MTEGTPDPLEEGVMPPDLSSAAVTPDGAVASTGPVNCAEELSRTAKSSSSVIAGEVVSCL